MGSVEIKTPEEVVLPDVTRTPVSLEEQSAVESHKSKKLGLYFIESDDRRTPLKGENIGGGGTTRVNIYT